MINAVLTSLFDFIGFFIVGTVLLGAVAFPGVYGLIMAFKYGITGQPTDEVPSSDTPAATSQSQLPSKRAA